MISETMLSLRDAYAAQLMVIADADDRVIVLDADLGKSTRTQDFHDKYPDRYINVGIAEQNLVSIAAGLALAGDVPLVNSFASFLTRRATDQIAMSVAYPNLPVHFFGFHGGVNLGEDGASQQAVEDLGIMQAIPNIRVYAPIDARDLAAVMTEAVGLSMPTYVRLARLATPADLGGEQLDGMRILRQGAGPLVAVAGPLAASVLELVDQSARLSGLDPIIVGLTRIKPVPAGLLPLLESRDGLIAVVEEHNVHGGVADAVSQFLDRQRLPHLVARLGIQDRFGESGPPRALLEHLGLAGSALEARLVEALEGCH